MYIYIYIYIFTHIKTYQEAILINMDIFIININFFVIFISNKNWQNHWGKKSIVDMTYWRENEKDILYTSSIWQHHRISNEFVCNCLSFFVSADVVSNKSIPSLSLMSSSTQWFSSTTALDENPFSRRDRDESFFFFCYRLIFLTGWQKI